MSDQLVRQGACLGCGAELPPKTWNGRDRKWCSERCRKQTLYSGTCVDCGEPTNGYAGIGKAGERCKKCRHAKEHADRIWTRERILADGRRWQELTGRCPVVGDWNRYINRGERRVLIDAVHVLTGPWPHAWCVLREFGSWREFIAELGGEAFPAGSGQPGQSKRMRTEELRALLNGRFRDAA